ncbi:MAG TPA: molybdopterin-dependent oxidoreductase, partial [Actinomycetota bacterium]|nr:molybdopterin-dependent oxidoreductase [Actinomycetota bacterium]
MSERRGRELADEHERAGGAAAVTGAAAATVALAALHAVVPELLLPPLVVAEAILRATPGGVATFFIEVLGGIAQLLLILATTAGFLAATWLLGRAIPLLEPRVNGGVAVAAALLSFPLAITAFVVGAIASAPAGRLAVSLAIGLALGVTVTSWRFARLTRPPHPERPNAPGLHRREVIRATWATGAGVILAWTGLGRMALGGDGPEDGRLRVRARELFPDPPPADAELEAIGRLAPRRTPTADFYTIDTALIDPVVDAGSWRLEIGGLVGRRSELAYDELEALPAVTFDSTLVCISNEVGGDLISSGRWVGIPLRTLLE